MATCQWCKHKEICARPLSSDDIGDPLNDGSTDVCQVEVFLLLVSECIEFGNGDPPLEAVA